MTKRAARPADRRLGASHTRVVEWVDRKGARWDVTLGFDVVDGRMECTSVELLSDESPLRPVTTTTMRQLPLASFVHRERRALAREIDELLVPGRPLGRSGRAGSPEDKAMRAQLTESRDVMKGERRGKGGRPPLYGPEHFAQVAEVYTEAWQDDVPPTKAVADHWGVSRSTAAKWVARARSPELGLLGETEPRQAGGVIPAKRRKKGKR